MKRAKDERRIRLASLLMLSFAVLFNLYITSPVLSEGVNDAGDDQYHLSQAYYMRKLIVEERSIFGVVEAYGTGYPWFNSHQFLLYFLVAAVNLLSFNFLSVLSAHKLVLVLLYSLFPLGVYYLLDKFRQPHLLCGLGALLSVLPISGWGHTITAYFAIGLSSQVAGTLLFPFALGSFHELVVGGRGVRRTALLYVLTLFAHPYCGYFLVVASVLDVVVFLAGKKRRWSVSSVKRVASAAVLALLLSLFWIMPLPESIDYAPRNLRMQSVKSSFSPEMFFGGFVSGEILDSSDNFGFESGKNIRWPKNRGLGRLPVLTLLTALGLLYSAVKRSRFGVYCILVFSVSVVMVLGSDDIMFLKYLPFSEFANPKRVVFLLDFFAVCLSAQALYWVLSAAYDGVGRVVGDRRFGSLVAILLLLSVLYTPYRERFLTAEREVNVISHWIPGFNAMHKAIKDDGLGGRVHGNTEVGVKSPPVVLSQPWLLDTPYFRRIYSTRFWGEILKYPNVFRLFNVRYLVTGAGHEIPERMQPMLTELYGDRVYRLYRVEGDFGYAFLSHKKPALLSSTEKGWCREAEVWLHYYKGHERGDSVPFIVEYRGQDVDAWDYSQLLVYDREPDKSLLKAFGGRVFEGEGKPHDTVRTAINDSMKEDVESRITVLSRTAHHYHARVESGKPGLLVYKIRYHPNWRVKVDGVGRETLRVTPEYIAVLIKPGTHTIKFEYKPPLRQKIFNLVSLATLFFILAPLMLLSGFKKKLLVFLKPTRKFMKSKRRELRKKLRDFKKKTRNLLNRLTRKHVAVITAVVLLSAITVFGVINVAHTLWVAFVLLALGVFPGLVFYLYFKRGEVLLLEALPLALVLSPAITSLSHIVLGLLGAHILFSILAVEVAAVYTAVKLVDWRKRRLVYSKTELKVLMTTAILITLLLATPAIVNPKVRFRMDNRFHAGIVYSILNTGVPPESPSMAGYPVLYYWFYDLASAVISYAGGIHPATAIHMMNYIGFFSLLVMLWLLSKSFGGGIKANFMSVVFIAFGLNAWVGVRKVYEIVDGTLVLSSIVCPLHTIKNVMEGGAGSSIFVGYLTAHPLALALSAIVACLYCLSEYRKNKGREFLFYLLPCSIMAVCYHSLIGIYYAVAAGLFVLLQFVFSDRRVALNVALVLILSSILVVPYAMNIGSTHSSDPTEYIRDWDGMLKRAKRIKAVLEDRFQIVLVFALIGLIASLRKLNLVLVSSLMGFFLPYIVLKTPGGSWKYLYLWMISLSLLAGSGFAVLLSKIPSRKTRLAFIATMIIILLPTNLLIVYGYAMCPWTPPDMPTALVYSWIRESTPKQSVFVLEERFYGYFRHFSERSAFLYRDGYFRTLIYDKQEIERRQQLVDNVLGGQDLPESAAEICGITQRPTYVLLAPKQLRRNKSLLAGFSENVELFDVNTLETDVGDSAVIKIKCTENLFY